MGDDDVRFNIRQWPGQARATRILLNPAKRTDVFACAGTGAGKTYWSATVCTMLSYQNPPSCNGMVVAPTYQMIEDTVRTVFEAFWDEHEIPWEWEAGRMRYFLPAPRNYILLRSGEFPDRLRGKTLAYTSIEEACYQAKGRAVLKEVYKRCRDPRARMLRVFGSSTPNGFDFMYEHFAKPGRPSEASTECVTWATTENKVVMETDFLELLMAVLGDSDEAKQEIWAQFLVLGMGRAYYAFDRIENEAYVRAHPEQFRVSAKQPLDLCVDFNVDPSGWVISQGEGEPGDPIRALDEITVKGDKSTWLALDEFQKRYKHHANGKNVRVFGDATGHNRKTTGPADFSMIEQVLPEASFHVRHRNPAEKDRVLAVNVAICDGHKNRRLYIHPKRCPELLTDFEQVQMKNGQIDKQRDQRRTHWSDALGYKVQYVRPVRVHTAAERVRIQREGVRTAEDVYKEWLAS